MVVKWLVTIFCCFVLFTIVQRSFLHKVVFCNVGQGSATLIQVGYIQVLVDTGPNRAVLACLGRHMPLFDDTVEYIIISHPQKDHDGALPLIANRYKIQTIIAHKKYLLSRSDSSVKSMSLFIHIPNVHITVSKASQIYKSVNESAYVVTIQSKKELFFLSSDISGYQLRKLIPKSVTIFTVPHHGSKNGMYANSLSDVSPRLAVISVGKNNYGHPHATVINFLNERNIPMWRTDIDGELSIPL